MRTVIVRFARPAVSTHPATRALKHLEQQLGELRLPFSGWVTDGGERGVLVVSEGFFNDNRAVFDTLEDMTFEPELRGGKEVS